MPAIARARVGITWLLRSERLGIPKLDWVGCAGLADMAGKRPLCASGPMMSALNFWSFCFKTKGQETYARCHRYLLAFCP
jgi:hypothetical protein